MRDLTKRFVIYMRVSSDDQKLDMQIDDLKKYAELRQFKIVEVIEEKISSTKKKRPGYLKVIELVRQRKVDGVLVWKYDRFARSTTELLNSMEEFAALGVEFISFKDNVDTTTVHGKLIFKILASVAEFEREQLSMRIRAGMKAAKARGKRIGKKPIPKGKVDNLFILKEKGIPATQICKKLDISRSTYYNIVNNKHVATK